MVTPSTSVGNHTGAVVDPSPRQPKKVLAEIAFLTVLITTACTVVTYAAIGTSDFQALIRWAEDSGEELRDQIGWSLAAYLTVLLGFYAVVAGGQIFGSRAYAARTRRALGLAAELIAASVIPPLLIIVISCTVHPSQWSILFVLVPVSGIIWFLGIQIGAFILFEPELRRTMAMEALAWASKQMDIIGHQSKRPILAVLPLNAAAVATIASVIAFSNHRFWVNVAIWLLLFLAALVLLGLNTFTLYDTKTSSGWFSRSMSWLLPVFVTAIGVLVGILMGYQHDGQDGVAVALVPVLTLAITIWPQAAHGTFFIEWSIQGVAARMAARTLEKRCQKAREELQELELEEEIPELPTTRQRIVAALFHVLYGYPIEYTGSSAKGRG